MKKYILSFLFVLLFCVSSYSQGLYYTKYNFFFQGYGWHSTEALVGWYGPTQHSIMRIRYTIPNTNSVALVEQRITFLNYGQNGYVLHGDNPRFINAVPVGHVYNSDSLIFEPTGYGYFGLTKVVDTVTKQLGVPVDFRPINQNEIVTTLRYFGFETPTYNPTVTPSSSSVTLHLIVVADVEDSEIGADIDANRVKKEFGIVANELGLKTNFITLTNSSFSKESVLNTLNNLRPSSNDIVIFVYSGHGFRYSSDTDPYPRFYLVRNRQNPDANNLQAAEVYNILKKKGAKLNITIVDACNNEIRTRKPEYNPLLSLKNSDAGINRVAIQKLFLNTKANIIVAAASKGETSVGNSIQGGVFIRSLMNSFRAETSLINNATPTWTNIINKARDEAYQTPRPNGKQNAVYYID